jgi:general stress protein 26
MRKGASMNDLERSLRRVAEVVRRIRVAMLVTFSRDGSPHARPMATRSVDPAQFDGTLWFMTDATSEKVDELHDNPSAMAIYAGRSHRFAVLRGRAVAERDPSRARELWSLDARGWWPDGPESRSLVVIRFLVGSAELWRAPGALTYYYRLAASLMTGRRIAADAEHEFFEVQATPGR